MNPRTLLCSLAVLALPSVAHASLGAAWNTPVNGTVDGVSVGDLDDDGQLEVASIVRGASYDSVVVHDAAGTERWRVNAATELAGFPTFANFDGVPGDEIGYCELATTGVCRVLDRDGKPLWASGPYYYPGMSMGAPAAADVDGNGTMDMIVMSWGGYVALLDGATGAQQWYYDAWASYEELFHGHAAIGDLDNDGDLDIVVGGAHHGTVIALDATTGTELWANDDLFEVGGVFSGNGVALADLDGIQGALEVVFAVDAATPVVTALNSDGTNRWSTLVPGASYSWHSPVVADLDVNGLPEVILQSGYRSLAIYTNEGVESRSELLADGHWMGSVALVDVTGDYQPELIAFTKNAVYVYAHNLALLDQLAVSGAGFNAGACVADLDGDDVGEIVAGGYTDGHVRAISLGTSINYGWTSVMGASGHSGFLQTQEPPEIPPQGAGEGTTSGEEGMTQGGMHL